MFEVDSSKSLKADNEVQKRPPTEREVRRRRPRRWILARFIVTSWDRPCFEHHHLSRQHDFSHALHLMIER